MARTHVLLLAAWLATPAAARKPEPLPDLGAITLDRRQPAIDATIAGVSTRLAVTLNEGTYLSAPFAARVPLDWRKGELELVGRVRVQHREAIGPVAIAGVTVPMLLQTQDEPCCDGRDGAIAATRLPWSVVRIGDRGLAGERRFPATSDERSGISIPWQVGRDTIHVVLAPDVPETVATVSAAAILARVYGGHLLDPVRQVTVAYGIARSVRDIALDRPATLLGFRIDRIAVRIGDFAGDATLPAPEPTPVAGDAIIVRHKRVPPQFRWAAITIGRDLLGGCAVISVYRDAGEIGLVCDG